MSVSIWEQFCRILIAWKTPRMIIMCTLPTSLHRITLGHRNKHCNINKVICYSCDGKGDTKTADKGVSQTEASRSSVILLSLMNKNTRSVVIMNTVNDGRCISKKRSVISIASSPSQQFIPLRPCSLQSSFLPGILIWAGSDLLARFCDEQVDSYVCFFFFPWVPQKLLPHMMWDTHLPCSPIRQG